MATDAPSSRSMMLENTTVLPPPVGNTASTSFAPWLQASWMSSSRVFWYNRSSNAMPNPHRHRKPSLKFRRWSHVNHIGIEHFDNLAVHARAIVLDPDEKVAVSIWKPRHRPRFIVHAVDAHHTSPAQTCSIFANAFSQAQRMPFAMLTRTPSSR